MVDNLCVLTGLTLRLLCVHSKGAHVQRHRLSHPRRPLSVIPLGIIRVRMDQRRQRSSVNDQPGDESSELFCVPVNI
jgi:hypothetical protein